jgi:hypothetical protein
MQQRAQLPRASSRRATPMHSARTSLLDCDGVAVVVVVVADISLMHYNTPAVTPFTPGAIWCFVCRVNCHIVDIEKGSPLSKKSATVHRQSSTNFRQF